VTRNPAIVLNRRAWQAPRAHPRRSSQQNSMKRPSGVLSVMLVEDL